MEPLTGHFPNIFRTVPHFQIAGVTLKAGAVFYFKKEFDHV